MSASGSLSVGGGGLAPLRIGRSNTLHLSVGAPSDEDDDDDEMDEGESPPPLSSLSPSPPPYPPPSQLLPFVPLYQHGIVHQLLLIRKKKSHSLIYQGDLLLEYYLE